MLNAILHGKKYGTGLEGIQISQGFGRAEDLLTSTVFERLLYLPDASVIAILFNPTAWVHAETKSPTRISNRTSESSSE
jgi:hypothetical protein